MDSGVHEVVDLCGVEPFGIGVVLRAWDKEGVEALGNRRQAHKLDVALDERLLLLLVQPVASSLVDFVHGFGIELLVVDGLAEVDLVCDVGTDVASRACEVGDDVHVVAGADERGIATFLSRGGGVGAEFIDSWELEHVLQRGLLALGDAVDFVEVDKSVACEHKQRLASVGKREVFREIGREGRGHEAAAEGALAYALRAYEDEDGLVAPTSVDAHPEGNHAEEPRVGKGVPCVVVGRHATEELVDARLFVPFGQLFEVGVEGVVGDNTIGVEIASYVPVPQVDALFQRVEGNGVEHTLIDRAVVEFVLATFDVFRYARNLVVAEDVPACHKLILCRYAGDGF